MLLPVLILTWFLKVNALQRVSRRSWLVGTFIAVAMVALITSRESRTTSTEMISESKSPAINEPVALQVLSDDIPSFDTDSLIMLKVKKNIHQAFIMKLL